jgi:S1-C subfamily serine protease
VIKCSEGIMKKIISIIICVFVLSLMHGEAAYAKEPFILDNLPEMIMRFKHSAVLILVGPKKRIAGTGFLALHNKNALVVITNKHVALSGNPIFIRVNATDNVVDYRAKVLNIHDDQDLAIIQVSGVDKDKKWISTDRFIPKEMFGSETDIMEGKEVVYVGFPLGLGVGDKNHPVSRTGLIAQAIPGREKYLVDGVASKGNSGSPVFERKTGKLIGMVTSYKPDFIDSFEGEVLLTRIPFNSGLSEIISVEVIKKFMNNSK